MPTATCPIPAHESSHVRRAWRARSDDAFHEAVVQMEALRQTRGGDRNGRAQNDGKHSPLQAVELDPHGQGFQPLSRDRFETRIEGRLFHAGLFPPLPEALSSALASAVSRPVACAAAVRVLSVFRIGQPRTEPTPPLRNTAIFRLWTALVDRSRASIILTPMPMRGKVIRFPRFPQESGGERGLVEVRRCDQAEALVLKGLFESEGIPTLLRSRLAHSVYPFSVGGQGEVVVLVPASEAALSRRLLFRLASSPPTPLPQ